MESAKAKVSLGIFGIGDPEDRTVRIYLGNNVYMEAVLPTGVSLDGYSELELFIEVPLAKP